MMNNLFKKKKKNEKYICTVSVVRSTNLPIANQNKMYAYIENSSILITSVKLLMVHHKSSVYVRKQKNILNND